MPLLGLDEAQAVESNDESIDREEGKPWGLEVFETIFDHHPDLDRSLLYVFFKTVNAVINI